MHNFTLGVDKLIPDAGYKEDDRQVFRDKSLMNKKV